MANPQCENGYTKIANEIMEAFSRTRISGEARQVLDFIIRKTYGFNKKEDRISLSQFEKATKLKKPNIVRAIKRLISMNIVIQIDNDKGNKYRLNKDFDTWKPLKKQKIHGIALSKMIKTVIQIDNKSLSKMIPTKDNTTKETMTKEILRSSEAANLNTLINLFKEVNPSYKTLYANKTQRGCLERLVKEHTYKKVEAIIKALPQIINRKYAPRVTTPYQLENKLGEIAAFIKQENQSPYDARDL